jgi:hypothetical protein
MLRYVAILMLLTVIPVSRAAAVDTLDVKAEPVSSGYSNDPVMANPEEYGFIGIVKKPVDLDELAEALHRLLGAEVP